MTRKFRLTEEGDSDRPPIAFLPLDIVKLLASFLSSKDLATLRAVSTFFSETLRKTMLERLTNHSANRMLMSQGITGRTDVISFFYLFGGRVYAWGDNRCGQLGQGHYERVNRPTQIDEKIDVRQLAVFGQSAFCVTELGDVRAWGENDPGLLGLGHTDKVNTPTEIEALNNLNVRQLVFSAGSTFCVTDQGVYAWGFNRMGTCGLEHNMDFVITPTEIEALKDVNVRQLVTITGSTFCVTDQGVYAWGDNRFGQLGLEHERGYVNTPTRIEALKDINVRQFIDFEETRFCITDQGVYAWGDNYRGQCGLGHNDNVYTPTRVKAFDNQIIRELFVSGNSCFCVTEQGGVYAWGCNRYGQLGFGHKDNLNTPTRIEAFDNLNVRQLVASSGNTFCLTDQGVYAWGDNRHGQLGLGHNEEVNSIPTPITALKDKNVRQLFAFGGSIFCITDQGMYAWGLNDFGQLGLGHFRFVYTPERVSFSGDMISRFHESVAQLETPECEIKPKAIECGSGFFVVPEAEAAEKREPAQGEPSKRCVFC